MPKALIIDDSRAIRTILARILERLGFSNVQAANGIEALEKLKNEEVSLICVDYNMPEMNGVEFLVEMRKSLGRTVPAMMITTETHIKIMQKAFEAGVSEYLMKPFTEDMVREKLDILNLLPREPCA
jgi:two-component system chemotaxis response regulator CheY